MLLCSDVHTHFTACQSPTTQSTVGREASVKKCLEKETFTVIISSFITVQSCRRGESCRSRGGCNGTDCAGVLLCLLFGAIFTVIKTAAGERRRGHGRKQEEIIGWKLEARGEALEKSTVEAREEIRHLGEDGVKDQHLEGGGGGMIMEGK